MTEKTQRIEGLLIALAYASDEHREKIAEAHVVGGFNAAGMDAVSNQDRAKFAAWLEYFCGVKLDDNETFVDALIRARQDQRTRSNQIPHQYMEPHG